jgi:hypothetical protein
MPGNGAGVGTRGAGTRPRDVPPVRLPPRRGREHLADGTWPCPHPADSGQLHAMAPHPDGARQAESVVAALLAVPRGIDLRAPVPALAGGQEVHGASSSVADRTARSARCRAERGPCYRAQNEVRTSIVSRATSPLISPAPTTTRRRPWATNADATPSAPNRISRSRCPTATMATDGSARRVINLGPLDRGIGPPPAAQRQRPVARRSPPLPSTGPRGWRAPWAFRMAAADRCRHA